MAVPRGRQAPSLLLNSAVDLLQVQPAQSRAEVNLWTHLANHCNADRYTGTPVALKRMMMKDVMGPHE